MFAAKKSASGVEHTLRMRALNRCKVHCTKNTRAACISRSVSLHILLGAGFFVKYEFLLPALRRRIFFVMRGIWQFEERSILDVCEYRKLPYNEAVRKKDKPYYSMIPATTPDPTVRPPSRIANLSPSSIAIGVIRLIVIVMLSPGMHISTPSGS